MNQEDKRHARKRVQHCLLEKWSKEEQLVYFESFQHYDGDFKLIAAELNKTFPKRNYWPSRLQSAHQFKIKNKPLTYAEIKKFIKIYLQVIQCKVVNRKWKKIGKLFDKTCSYNIIENRFYSFNRYAMFKMIYTYASNRNHFLYIRRTQRFRMSLYTQIYYFATLELQFHEKFDQIFVELCNSCAKYLYLLKEWTDHKILYCKGFDLPHKAEQFPDVSEEEFDQVFESILFLDLIFRICYDIDPYSRKDIILCNPIIELEYKEIALKIRNNNGHSVYKQQNIHFNITQSEGRISSEIFPQIDTEQIQHLLKSETVQLLIPHMSYLYKDLQPTSGYETTEPSNKYDL